MTRKADPARRDEIETAVLHYVLEHGIADLSLRPLAEALGVSTYTLVYHFGSKDGLIAAVLGALEDRLREQLGAWVVGTATSPSVLLRRLWGWATAPESRVQSRLFFELYGLALQQPERFPGLLKRAGTGSWVAFLQQLLAQSGLVEAEAELAATLVVTTIVGLQLDLLTTGDLQRTSAAIDAMADFLERFGV
jgi:AcrR family transcriptional regulator